MLKRKKSNGYNIQNEFRNSVLGVFVGIIFLFPLYWMIVTSLKSQVEIFQVPTPLWPSKVHFESYADQFSGKYYDTMNGFKNSMIISVCSMILSTVLAIPAAYGLARYRIRGRKAIIITFLITQMMPSSLLLIPLFIQFKNMNLLNTYLGVIIADSTIGIPFSVIILRTYFVSIPKEIEEAAQIDGCGHFGAFVRIMLPVAFPGVVVAMVFSLMFAWGDLVFGLNMLPEAMRPVTSGMYNYIQQYETIWNFIMAFGVIAILPVLIIFIFMQNYIVSGLTNGAVKA